MMNGIPIPRPTPRGTFDDESSEPAVGGGVIVAAEDADEPAMDGVVAVEGGIVTTDCEADMAMFRFATWNGRSTKLPGSIWK
jgi:hypothetical protein